MDRSEPSFGVSDFLKGRARAGKDLRVHLSQRDGADLHDKMRQAYFWIINNAVICPYYDIEYGERSKHRNALGDEIALHDSMSYSSFILVPMLTLFTCRRALLVGGHSVEDPELKYGLAVTGIVHPDRLKKNSSARAGDVLILGKGLGLGVLAAALKKGVLSAGGYTQLIAAATQLNTVGSVLATLEGVHALTDVTGFGLLGHLLEICRGSGLGAELKFEQVPVLSSALPLAQQGCGPGATDRNLASYGHEVDFDVRLQDWQRRLLADVQTSGGLLVSVAPDAVGDVLACFYQAGFKQAAVIGVMKAGTANVVVS